MGKIGKAMMRGLERLRIVRERKDPQVKTSGDPEDRFDSYKGVNLGIIKAGKFNNDAETITKMTVVDKEGARKLKRQLESGGRFKHVKVDPEGERTSKRISSEIFKGVVLFNRWKVGKYTTIHGGADETRYKVKAKIPMSIGGYADMKTEVSATVPAGWDVKTYSGAFFR